MRRGIPMVLMVAMSGVGCWLIGSPASGVPAEANGNNVTISVTPTPGRAPAANKMNDNESSNIFLKNLPTGFQQPNDDAGRLLLREYGAVFLARNGAVPPNKVVFRDEADVLAFQSSLKNSVASIGGYRMDLQESAMAALKDAIAEARSAGLSISPRGSDSGRRSYAHTVTLWASRVAPGLTYWAGKGKITQAEARRIRSMTPYEQVPEILALEKDRIFFAKSLSKSIIYSVAPPGTSQHLSMLALDVKEFNEPRVRAILGKHGWFQTVASDLPHFTYIGVAESKLPTLGLKKEVSGGRVFWIPDMD